MKEPYKTDLLKFLTVVGILGAVFAVATVTEENDRRTEKKALERAILVSRERCDGDASNTIRLHLVTKGEHPFKATCDLESELPYLDPNYEKTLPNGTELPIYVWRKIGRLRKVKENKKKGGR